MIQCTRRLNKTTSLLPFYFQSLGKDSYIKFKRQFKDSSTMVVKSKEHRFSDIEYLSKGGNVERRYISVILSSNEEENKEY